MPFKFERLEVWQKAMDIGESLDKLATAFPAKELYNLGNQMRRAADSIALNIAEGSGATTNAEQCRFINIAIRSCHEVVCCLHKAKRRTYLNENDFVAHYNNLEILVRQLQAFRNKLQQGK